MDVLSSSLLSALNRQLKGAKQHLDVLSQSPALQSPMGYLNQKEKSVEILKNRLVSAQNAAITQKNQRFITCVAKLEAMSPLKVLSRGYSMVQTTQGHLLSSISQVELGERIHVQLRDGILNAVVMDKKETEG